MWENQMRKIIYMGEFDGRNYYYNTRTKEGLVALDSETIKKNGRRKRVPKYFNHDAFLVILNFGSTDVSDTGFSWYALSKADDYSLYYAFNSNTLTVHPFYGGVLILQC